jgi:hypothetical protein
MNGDWDTSWAIILDLGSLSVIVKLASKCLEERNVDSPLAAFWTDDLQRSTKVALNSAENRIVRGSDTGRIGVGFNQMQ